MTEVELDHPTEKPGHLTILVLVSCLPVVREPAGPKLRWNSTAKFILGGNEGPQGNLFV